MRNQPADMTRTERTVGTGGVSWRSVASSDDGTRRVARLLDWGSIYTPTDSGGRSLVEHGIRFIYQRPGAVFAFAAKKMQSPANARKRLGQSCPNSSGRAILCNEQHCSALRMTECPCGSRKEPLRMSLSGPRQVEA